MTDHFGNDIQEDNQFDNQGPSNVDEFGISSHGLRDPIPGNGTNNEVNDELGRYRGQSMRMQNRVRNSPHANIDRVHRSNSNNITTNRNNNNNYFDDNANNSIPGSNVNVNSESVDVSSEESNNNESRNRENIGMIEIVEERKTHSNDNSILSIQNNSAMNQNNAEGSYYGYSHLRPNNNSYRISNSSQNVNNNRSPNQIPSKVNNKQQPKDISNNSNQHLLSKGPDFKLLENLNRNLKTTDEKQESKVKKMKKSTLQTMQSFEIPTCRICFAVTERMNPLICPCKCTGSVKYVHIECLKTWLKSRTTIKVYKNLTVITFKNSSCEICKYIYNERIQIGNKIEHILNYDKPKGENYLILEGFNWESKETKNWYLVHLDKPSDCIHFGRANYSDVRMSCISVSRDHAYLRLSSEGKFYLEDLNSKFGTLILLKDSLSIIPNHKLVVQYNNLLMSYVARLNFVNICCCSKRLNLEVSSYNEMYEQILEYTRHTRKNSDLVKVKYYSLADYVSRNKELKKHIVKQEKKRLTEKKGDYEVIDLFIGKAKVEDGSSKEDTIRYKVKEDIVDHRSQEDVDDPFHIEVKRKEEDSNGKEKESKDKNRAEANNDKLKGSPGSKLAQSNEINYMDYLNKKSQEEKLEENLLKEEVSKSNSNDNDDKQED
eukprot:CAMPEP_0170523848 /NCGR_PEP_ID=MMETSP0209-20121228/9284_1 /TAXON_ID=665100 ORGANISM="Litonotus pictus, Strain P1" /NCGR_SAMPLE_ID=MMETSP0209 /ASSEMBLY_ACC=CAM_ASM_000301 /LENGTH=659 /DNA_ID=CAMNT_0010812179 /DNA_START=291 /DNA_END=2270 /DNA_ORIENTATION=-